MKKISILIADDHRLVRETWGIVLNSDPRFKVVAECRDASEAIEMTKTKEPRIVLMDIHMPHHSGLEATQEICRLCPSSKVIALTMYSQPEYAKKMLQLGASGYVTKNSSKEEMIQAILEVNRGNKYVCEEVRTMLTEELSADRKNVPDVFLLSKREVEIVQFVKEGLSSKRIADALHISSKTVQVHRHNILKKLKLKNCVSLVNYVNSQALMLKNY
jgi:DNA-binding NarL/FixJ family response regulator